MFTYVGGSSVSDEVKGPAFPEGRKPTRDETKEYKILQNKLRKYRTAIIKTLGLLLLCSGSLCVRACVRACARVCVCVCVCADRGTKGSIVQRRHWLLLQAKTCNLRRVVIGYLKTCKSCKRKCDTCTRITCTTCSFQCVTKSCFCLSYVVAVVPFLNEVLPAKRPDNL